MKYHFYFLSILFLLVAQPIISQDRHFSQFYLSPVNLNPSLTGVADGGRLIANYRNQWSSVLGSNAFHTYALSYDQPINLKSGDRLGIGIN